MKEKIALCVQSCHIMYKLSGKLILLKYLLIIQNFCR